MSISLSKDLKSFVFLCILSICFHFKILRTKSVDSLSFQSTLFWFILSYLKKIVWEWIFLVLEFYQNFLRKKSPKSSVTTVLMRLTDWLYWIIIGYFCKLKKKISLQISQNQSYMLIFVLLISKKKNYLQNRPPLPIRGYYLIKRDFITLQRLNSENYFC